MNVTLRDLVYRGISILLAQEPKVGFQLNAVSIVGTTFRVRAPDRPPFPAWQTQDLRPCLYWPPWVSRVDTRWAPVPLRETFKQEEVAQRMVLRLIQRLQANVPVYQPLRQEFHDYWGSLVIGFAPVLSRSGFPLTDVDLVLLTSMIIFDLAVLLAPGSETGQGQPLPARIMPEAPIVRKLGERAQEIRASLRECLQQVGWHPDLWSESVLLGLLLHPLGVVWVRPPFHLGPNFGRSELERGIELAIEAPDTSYRSANKLHRAYRHAFGGGREPERPGPRPGQPRRPAAQRDEFEKYVLDRSRAGLTPYLISTDADANRLYRMARHDHMAILTEQAVRRVLRKLRSH